MPPKATGSTRNGHKATQNRSQARNAQKLVKASATLKAKNMRSQVATVKHAVGKSTGSKEPNKSSPANKEAAHSHRVLSDANQPNTRSSGQQAPQSKSQSTQKTPSRPQPADDSGRGTTPAQSRSKGPTPIANGHRKSKGVPSFDAPDEEEEEDELEDDEDDIYSLLDKDVLTEDDRDDEEAGDDDEIVSKTPKNRTPGKGHVIESPSSPSGWGDSSGDQHILRKQLLEKEKLIRQYQTEIVQKDREIKRTRVEASSEEPPSKKAKRSSEDDDNDDLTASKEYAKHIRDLGAKYACLYVTWGEPEDIFGWEELQDDLDAEIEATATDTDSEEAGSGGEVSSGGRGMGNASQEETDEEEDDDSVEAPPTARITLEMIEEVEAGVDMLTTEAGQRDYTTLAAKEFYKALNRNDRHNFFKPQFQKLFMFGLKKFRSGLLSGLSKLPDAVFGIKLAEGQLGIFMDPKTRGSIAEIKDLKSNTFFQKDDPDIPLEDRAYRHQCIEKLLCRTLFGENAIFEGKKSNKANHTYGLKWRIRKMTPQLIALAMTLARHIISCASEASAGSDSNKYYWVALYSLLKIEGAVPARIDKLLKYYDKILRFSSDDKFLSPEDNELLLQLCSADG